jgi:lysophospholipase L1-like esterase
MKRFSLILFFVICACGFTSKRQHDPMANITQKEYTYLALGDSYTIGQSVKEEDNFPNRAIRTLNAGNPVFSPARIIAKTGWATDELESAIKLAEKNNELLPSYDFVSLLIGVNDQYRERNIENYEPAFRQLLAKAIHFAGDHADHVLVISIPDWGVTPFAEGRDREKIAKEIDRYNAINKMVTEENHVLYLDITPWTREAANDISLITMDGLHPSAKEYERWAVAIIKFFKPKM